MLLAGLDHKLHHDQRADGDDQIVLVACGHQLVQSGGNNALGTVAAVVGHNAQLVAAGPELVLQDQQILIAEADHAVHHTALIVQFLGNGQCNGTAHAAAHNAHLLQTLGLGGAAQRADKIVDTIACVQAVQLHGGTAHDLENDIHSALFAVVTGHSQGDALTVLKRTYNDELTRLCLFGDQRGFNDHLCHGGVQRDLFSDLIHRVCSFMLTFPSPRTKTRAGLQGVGATFLYDLLTRSIIIVPGVECKLIFFASAGRNLNEIE